MSKNDGKCPNCGQSGERREGRLGGVYYLHYVDPMGWVEHWPGDHACLRRQVFQRDKALADVLRNLEWPDGAKPGVNCSPADETLLVVDAWKAELSRQNERHANNVLSYTEEVKDVRAENERLRQDLLEYGTHAAGCRAHPFTGWNSRDCGCGWEATREAAEAAKKGETDE